MTIPRIVQLHAIDAAALVGQATAGLLEPQAWIAPKFFYDALGSRLFDAITELDEYDLTRNESAVFATHGAAMCRAAAESCGSRPVLVDLGAGNCAKAARLFGTLRPLSYIAVDIAVDYLQSALRVLQAAHPQVEMVGVGLDFSERLQLPDGLVTGPALLFYPGSSIGNFDPDDAHRLLRQSREVARGGALLIGVDLLKDARSLQAAYDDALGVTAAFNLNVLRHLNRLIGANFDLREWRHVARFDAGASRIEMHLEARIATGVRWPGGERRFAAGERIHTESAYKWTAEGFAALLRDAGFARSRCWTDDRGRFAVFLADG